MTKRRSIASTGLGKRNGARSIACLISHVRKRREVMPRGTWIQLVKRSRRRDGSVKSSRTASQTCAGERMRAT